MMKKQVFCILGMVLSALFGARLGFCIGDVKEANKISTEQSPEKDRFEIEIKTVSYTSENFKDPFTVTVMPEPEAEEIQQITPLEKISLPAIKIQGIIWGTNRPQAIINDEVVEVGKTINETITILDITGSGIIVSYKNQKFALPAPSGIKTPDVKYKGGSRGK